MEPYGAYQCIGGNSNGVIMETFCPLLTPFPTDNTLCSNGKLVYRLECTSEGRDSLHYSQSHTFAKWNCSVVTCIEVIVYYRP